MILDYLAANPVHNVFEDCQNMHESALNKKANSSFSQQTFNNQKSSKNSRLIPQKIKDQFIELVTYNNFSLKNAAKHLNMSYSTAKKIYTRFRNKNKLTTTKSIKSSLKRAQFIEISSHIPQPITIITTFAGHQNKSQNQTDESGVSGQKSIKIDMNGNN